MAGLKTLGSYALGVFNALETPAYLLGAGICKVLGLPFNDNSFINRLGHDYIKMAKKTPEFFNEIPDKWNTKNVDTEFHYDDYDLEITYLSDKSIIPRIFNVRHKILKY